MTITPYHDNTDFDIAQRHNLEKQQIIDLNGKLLDVANEFSGMHISKARPLIVEKLREKGLLEKIDDNYIHRIAKNSRGNGKIEPQILMQWFVNVNKEFKLPQSLIEGIKSGEETTLKKIMRTVIKSGQIKILPEKFEKTYFHWIDNLRDWNISRQIWYGHRIPVWYKDDETYCGEKSPGEGWQQDPDTLDTWFSSSLWTFATLGWPEETEDLKNFHPTDVLETGYDILFFWVARMILMSGFILGEVPFKTIYLHGLVRDKKGKKMSKSIGNIIDPVDMIEKYGADATRLSLIIGAPAGNDTSLSEDKVKGYKHFTNKIWNATRFVMMNLEGFSSESVPEYTEKDKETINELNDFSKEITDDIENYRFHLAGEKLYHYFWRVFADKIIEESKDRINSGNEKEKLNAQWLILTILSTLLKLLHPFIPFVTEILYKELPLSEKKDLLMIEEWPV